MKVIIYGHEQCPFCHKAKLTAELYGIDFLYHNVREDLDARAAIVGMGFSTVPQIFEDLGDTTRHIGGFEDFIKEITND